MMVGVVGVVGILRRPVGEGMVGAGMLLVDCVSLHCKHQPEQHQEQGRKEDMRAQEGPTSCCREAGGHDGAGLGWGVKPFSTCGFPRGPVNCAVGFGCFVSA